MDMPILAEIASEESEPGYSGPAGCPVCREELVLPDELLVTEILECDNCGAELEVMALRPLVLALAPEVEEDWGE
jgi:alpha-aminoadipate carrier protein LysW